MSCCELAVRFRCEVMINMNFKKGCKVEVRNMREVPTGSWWHAEIISGNGRFYKVRYHCPPHDMGGTDEERVSRKAIRPCPPAIKLSANWVTGDMIEAFDSESWKIAELLMVLDENHYSVRLLGSFSSLKMHYLNVRMRQSWEDGKWVVIRKNFSSYNCGILRSADELELIRPEPCKMFQNDALYGNTTCKKKLGLLEHLKSGTKRKSEFLLSEVENAQKSKNRRTVQKHVSQKQLYGGNSSTLLGDNCYENRTEDSEMKQRWGKLKAEVAFAQGRSSEADILETNVFSVCSSIGSNNLDVLTGCGLDLNDYSDDAHSFPGLESSWKCTIPQEMDVDAQVHNMELHAYRATMNSLYASGPMSWEQEALMTNLRLTLHISTDEHLSELRHLVSGPELTALKLTSKVQDDGSVFLAFFALHNMVIMKTLPEDMSVVI